jgi:hypothetical protein
MAPGMKRTAPAGEASGLKRPESPFPAGILAPMIPAKLPAFPIDEALPALKAALAAHGKVLLHMTSNLRRRTPADTPRHPRMDGWWARSIRDPPW